MTRKRYFTAALCCVATCNQIVSKPMFYSCRTRLLIVRLEQVSRHRKTHASMLSQRSSLHSQTKISLLSFSSLWNMNRTLIAAVAILRSSIAAWTRRTCTASHRTCLCSALTFAVREPKRWVGTFHLLCATISVFVLSKSVGKCCTTELTHYSWKLFYVSAWK